MKRSIKLVLSLLFVVPLLSGCSDHTEHDYKEVITKQPTCTEPGEGHLECSHGDSYTEAKEIPALGHNEAIKRVSPTCTEQGYDVHYCTRCGEQLYVDNYVDAHGHNFVDDFTPPTCIATGHMERYCTHCGIYEIEPYDIEATGHSFKKIETVAPTCVTKGFDVIKCENCGVEKRTNYVAALNHDLFISAKIPANCLEFGQIVYSCTRCEYTHSIPDEDVPPLGHDYIKHEAESPDCDHAGHGVYFTCSRCDYNDLSKNMIDPLGHKYDEFVTSPTCTEPGYTTYVCKICGATEIGNQVPATGHHLEHHDEKTATCDHSGHKAYDTCTECDYSTYEEIPALGTEHEYVDRVVEPTTSEQGYTLHECIHCSDSYMSDFVNPLSAFRVKNSVEYVVEHPSLSSDYSWRNDDFYYFILFQGHIDDYPLHTYVSFSWNDEMEYMKSYPKTIREALPMDVLDTHINQQAVLNDEVKDTLADNCELDATGGIEKSTASSFDQTFYEKWPTSDISYPIEISDKSLTSVATKINSIESAYNPGENLDQFENDKDYIYAAVADADVYLAVIYDISNRLFTYKTYTVFDVEGIHEELFCSRNGVNIYTPTTTLDVKPEVSAKMVKPVSYETNHPYKMFKFTDTMTNGNGNINVKSGKTAEVTFKDSQIAEYIDKGYDTAYFNLSWGYNTSWWASDHSILFQIAWDNSHYLPYFENDHSNYVDFYGDNYRRYTKNHSDDSWRAYIQFYVSTDVFGNKNSFILRWANDATLDRGPYNIQVNLYLFKMSALEDEGYGTTFANFKYLPYYK